jgi:ABC-type transport system involved in multi-copper enzyme maturation permease subunit
VRTKRLLIIVPVFAAVMLLVTIVFPAKVVGEDGGLSGSFAAGVANQNIAMLLFFSGFFILSGYFYLQLLSIVLTSDAISAEWSSRTLFLLLSKPVPRAALVLGKFLGSAITVVGVVSVLISLDYALAVAVLPGSPSGESVAGFFLALGILLLGCLAFTAVGLFFSTLTRSTVTGILLALAAWMFLFPIIGSLDSIVNISQHGIEGVVREPGDLAWAVYLSPSSSMRVASNAMAPTASGDLNNVFARLFGFSAPGEPWAAALALVGHTILFLGLSLWVVRRRNFE